MHNKKGFFEFLLIATLIFIVVFAAYFQTLKMYFWIDDNALIYKLQHLNTYSGYWGRGIFGEGPYRHIIDQFVLFYPLFKTNPTPYYAVGIILYFFSAFAIYYFTKVISKNKWIAISSSIIYAAGFIGSKSIFGITNSWQGSRGIVMALITFLLLYRYLKTKNILVYLLSVILFFFSLDTVYIRAHGLIFAIIFFDLLFSPVKFTKNSLIRFVMRQLPYLSIFYYIYLSNTAYVSSFGVLHFLTDVINDKKYVLLSVPLQNIGNLFVPDAVTQSFDHFVSKELVALPSGFSLGSALAGIFFFALTGFLFFKWKKKEQQLSKFLLFSAVWMLGNMVVFFTRETTLILESTHRYFSYSFVGLAMFYGVSFYLIAKSFQKIKPLTIFLFLSVSIALTYLYLGNKFQYSFNKVRSLPARAFFSSFDREIPNIPKNAVIYFDIANNTEVKNRYNGFFGGMFSEAGNLAILSDTVEDYTKDFLVTYNYSEVKEMLDTKKITTDDIYAFYYDESGLRNTTELIRKSLITTISLPVPISTVSSSTQSNISNSTFTTSTNIGKGINYFLASHPIIDIDLPNNFPSYSPANLSFVLSITPKSSVPLPLTYRESDLTEIPDKSKTFAYLINRDNYRKNTIASAGSYWRDQEPKFALDGRLDTSWRGHRGYWDDIDRHITENVEYFMVDLRRVVTVSQVRWISGFPQIIPTNYLIQSSLDGKKWELAKKVTNGERLLDGSVITDSFKPTKARFIKMEILKTYGNDGPEIKEFEVIESEFDDLDINTIKRLEDNPFGDIQNQNELKEAFAFIQKKASMQVFWMSDADSSQDPTRYISLPVYVDSKPHTYIIQLPSTGLSWKKFTIRGVNFPADIVISSITLNYGQTSKPSQAQ